MKSLIARLLLVFALLATTTVGQTVDAFAHDPSHHPAAAAAGHDCCDPAVEHGHGHADQHQALPDASAADCHCDLGTCAPMVLGLDSAAPTRIALMQCDMARPDDAPAASGVIPLLRPPRA